ncbi:MAG: type I 3-dehydroquinate dehydratase, partial [Tepidisphaeraceae bacterium]
MTLLCVSIFVESAERALRDIADAASKGAQMVELRLDKVTNARDVQAILGSSKIPTIATCHPDWEGEAPHVNARLDFALLDEVVDDDASYIDFDLREFKQTGDWLPRGSRPGLIVSTHDYRGRPDRLLGLLEQLNASPGDVVKLAWTARSVRDNIEAFELLQSRQKPTIALCMGEAGLISRVLAKKFGAFLTYASLSRSDATASGQPTVDELQGLYRWDAINPRTKVYGVVGAPIGHSLSPAIHNAAFEAVGVDAVYLPMLVNPGYESFKAFMESFLAFEPLDLSGLSITLPHKENALRYLKEKQAQ